MPHCQCSSHKDGIVLCPDAASFQLLTSVHKGILLLLALLCEPPPPARDWSALPGWWGSLPPWEVRAPGGSAGSCEGHVAGSAGSRQHVQD